MSAVPRTTFPLLLLAMQLPDVSILCRASRSPASICASVSPCLPPADQGLECQHRDGLHSICAQRLLASERQAACCSPCELLRQAVRQ